MEPQARPEPKLSIEASLRAIEDACFVAKAEATQLDPDILTVHTEGIRTILKSIGVLGGPLDDRESSDLCCKNSDSNG